MKIFKHSPVSKPPLMERVQKNAVMALKCLLLLVKPALVAAAVTCGWYFWLFRPGRNFGGSALEVMVVAVSIPAVIYGVLLANPTVQTVWGEYKLMRIAVKRYDLDTFMDYCDEELSPVIHIVMGVTSMGCMVGLLGIKYPTVCLGGSVIFGVSFFFVLMYFVVKEMDDPRSGLWYIHGLHEEWRVLDPKEYRRKRQEKLRAEFLQKNTAILAASDDTERSDAELASR